MATDTEQEKLEGAHTDGSYSGLLEGLRRTPKSLPCSYLYDSVGSELYERITELEEYYPFRTEQAMLREHAKDIVSYIAPGAPAPVGFDEPYDRQQLVSDPARDACNARICFFSTCLVADLN